MSLFLVDIISALLYYSIKSLPSGVVAIVSKTRELILQELINSPDQYVSGAIISSRLGISRAAVSKQIKELRTRGYQIDALPNRGYLLKANPLPLDEKALARHGIIYKAAVDSTNHEARLLAEKGAPAFSTIVADQQLKGRGRLGRNWHSPPGSGLWFTMLLRPHDLNPAAVAPITLVTAAVVANLLHSLLNIPVQVKWPNDLLIRGKKTGGILTELKGEPDAIDYLVIGMGINVNQGADSFPQDLAGMATSLSLESGKQYNRTLLLIEIREVLLAAYQKFFREGFAPFRGLWLEHNTTLGKIVKVSWPGGEICGTACGLSKNGALLVKDSSGFTHTVNYGEIT